MKAEDLARFLRQRRELGSPELFLEGLTRKEMLRIAARARLGTPAAAPERHEAPAGGGERHEAPATASVEPTPGPAPGDRVTGEASSDEIGGMDYETLRSVALACERCGLAEGRTQVVFSDGSPSARVLVVGEAPGAREDETGLPFVGPAGKLLDLLLATVDLSREESVYICNVLKCRPPGNRNPLPDEIEACAPYLRRQIELVAPEVLLAVGTFAGQLLTGKNTSLGRLRGEVYSYHGVPLVVTYHPAALLRNAGWTRPTWDDLQLLRQILDGGA